MRSIGSVGKVILFSSVVIASVVASTGTAIAENSGFGYGNDSSQPTNYSSGPPYQADYTNNGTNIVLGGIDGGYSRSIGGYGDITSCPGAANDNPTDSSRANTNETYGDGYGTAGYFLLGGPGRDPAYNPSTYTNAKGYAWGQAQGQDAYTKWLNATDVTDKLIWADMEPGFGFEGWFAPCSATLKSSTHSAYFDGQVVSGFESKIVSLDSLLKVGVYSDTNYWDAAYGCSECGGGPGYIPGTYEWTYGSRPLNSPCPMGVSGLCSSSNLSISPVPNYDCTTSYCAQFFGGESYTSTTAIAWQWSTYHLPGSVCGLTQENCVGDVDQIYEPQYPH